MCSIVARLRGGDDYELLFTAPSNRREEVVAAAEATPITRIGVVTATADLAVLDEHGAPVDTGKRCLTIILCSDNKHRARWRLRC